MPYIFDYAFLLHTHLKHHLVLKFTVKIWYVTLSEGFSWQRSGICCLLSFGVGLVLLG